MQCQERKCLDEWVLIKTLKSVRYSFWLHIDQHKQEASIRLSHPVGCSMSTLSPLYMPSYYVIMPILQHLQHHRQKENRNRAFAKNLKWRATWDCTALYCQLEHFRNKKTKRYFSKVNLYINNQHWCTNLTGYIF